MQAMQSFMDTIEAAGRQVRFNALIVNVAEDIKQDCQTYRDAQRRDSESISNAYDRLFNNIAIALQNLPQHLQAEVLADLQDMGKI